ncbi:hypothetical protein FOMPIDRAFT_91083 [Fomitopsis schrenkii]|uniref:Uncharacterized protein n=1 Tax=Fomitopsis schrenkii TaxID=2126942 RepID=S8E9L0_FOMSC|nr:hypothetical protein FOMPIDRAFT_91083 [Fomitopsis schrenkii]
MSHTPSQECDPHFQKNFKRGLSFTLISDDLAQGTLVHERESEEGPVIKRMRITPASPDRILRRRHGRIHLKGATTARRHVARRTVGFRVSNDSEHISSKAFIEGTSAERLSRTIFGSPSLHKTRSAEDNEAGHIQDSDDSLAEDMVDVETVEEMLDSSTFGEDDSESEGATTPPQSVISDTEDHLAVTVREELNALRQEVRALQSSVQEVHGVMLVIKEELAAFASDA